MRSFDSARALTRSEFARRDGWYIDLDGARIGDLGTPRRVETFWCSYSLRCTATEHRRALQEDELWHRCTLVLRNRRTMEVAPRALVGGGTTGCSRRARPPARAPLRSDIGARARLPLGNGASPPTPRLLRMMAPLGGPVSETASSWAANTRSRRPRARWSRGTRVDRGVGRRLVLVS